MSGVDWVTGRVEYRTQDGESRVLYFENDGVVYVDTKRGIELPGWQDELEPFEGPGYCAYVEPKKEEK